jgi:hypothetical protein
MKIRLPIIIAVLLSIASVAHAQRGPMPTITTEVFGDKTTHSYIPEGDDNDWPNAKNRMYFATAAQAEAAGYHTAVFGNTRTHQYAPIADNPPWPFAQKIFFSGAAQAQAAGYHKLGTATATVKKTQVSKKSFEKQRAGMSSSRSGA